MPGQHERRNLQNLIVRNLENLGLDALRKVYAMTVQLGSKSGPQPEIAPLPEPEPGPAKTAKIVGEEKRVFKRLDTNVPLKYRILGTMETDGTRVVSEDISGGGARFVIVTEEDIQTGFLLELEIFLPSGANTIVTQAKVVWAQPMEDSAPDQEPPSDGKKKAKQLEVGLEFIDICRDDRVLIARYVHQQEVTRKQARAQQPKPRVAADLGAFLLQQLKSDDPAERERACRSLGEQKDKRAIAPLKNVIENDPEHKVREAARRAVQRIVAQPPSGQA